MVTSSDEVLPFFIRSIVVSLIRSADVRMRTAVLLGVNCGFQASDLIELTTDHLYLDADVPHHAMPQVKNARRRVAVLWPETVTAIRKLLKYRV